MDLSEEITEDTTLVDEGPLIGSVGSTASSSAQPRKPRIALACTRCKRRKQRCDGLHPRCTGCLKANASCVYERTLRPRYPGGKTLYINVLEERIAFLEARLPEHGQDHFIPPAMGAGPRQTPPPPTPASRRRSTGRRPSRGSTGSATDDEENSSLVDGVAYLSLCASGTTDTAPEPFYVGSSSGATIARLIQASVFQGAKSPPPGPTSPDVLRPSPLTGAATSSIPAPLYGPDNMDEFPYGSQAQTLFSVFFDRLHIRWPLLDRSLFCSIFQRQWEPGALSMVERSILHLIYAISARFLQLMRKICHVNPERHLALAIEPMDHILEQHNLATVQFLAMLAIYGSRSPYGAGSWSQIRYAITLCIELGLHRRQTAHHSPADLEMRKRVFWGCYCLDRMTTITLGRTFAIADRDINVDLPSESPSFQHLMSNGDEGWPNVSQFTHVIKLRQLQSRVFRTVWRVDKDILSNMSASDRAKIDGRIDDVHLKLGEWLNNIPLLPKETKGSVWMYDTELACHDSHDYFNLQYHKTVLSLYTALLPALPPSDPRFLSATRSAAAVCATYKTLNAHKTLSYTIIALHSCFIAGLTLVYCLWRDASLFDYNALEATRACSLCLTVFGEKWPGAVKYRDIFDAMSGSLLKSIMGGLRNNQDRDGTGSIPLEMEMQLPQQNPMPGISEVSPEPTVDCNVEGAPENVGLHQGNVLFSAVKDVFTDVEGSEPGGWHGWRMFNEMVRDDMAMAPPVTGVGVEGRDRRSEIWMEYDHIGSQAYP